MPRLTINSIEGYVTNIDRAKTPSAYASELRGWRQLRSDIVAERDFGTLNRYPTPPIRPNPFVNVLGVSGSVGSTITLQLDDTSHISNGDTLYVDEVSSIPTVVGKWTVANKQSSNVYTLMDSYPSSNQNDVSPIHAGTYTEEGESFTGDGGAIGKATFFLKKFGAPTGNVYAVLYAHTGTFHTNGTPTGAALATSNAVDVSTLTTSFALQDFTFASPYTTTPGTHYFVTVQYTGGDGSNYLVVGVNTGTPAPSGNFAKYIPSSWTSATNIAVCFYVYSLAVHYTVDLTGSKLGGGTYVSGGIATETPQTIFDQHNFGDNNGFEYDIVTTLDSSNNTHIYVYDPASTELSKWIELTRFFTALINGTPGASSKVCTFDTVLENGVAHTFAVNDIANYVLINITKSQTVFILSSTALTATSDTVLGTQGLGWSDNDVIQFYRFPCFKFNWTAANGGVYYDPTQAVIPSTSYTDGDVVIHGTVTLARDMYYKSLNVASDGILDTNNYRVFIQNASVNNGIIHNNGADANGRLGGAAKSSGFYQSQGAGVDGAVGPSTGYGSLPGVDGNNAPTRSTCLSNATPPIVLPATKGGNGIVPAQYTQVGGNPGAAGSPSVVTNVIYPTLADLVNGVVQTYLAPLSGGTPSGGQGAGNVTMGVGGNGGDGSGNGAPAGILSIHCPKWSGSGKFQANGGKGSDAAGGGDPPSNFQCGGGGTGSAGTGGSGGLIAIDCPDMSSFTGTIEAKGGIGGKRGTGGGHNAYGIDPNSASSINGCTGNTINPTIATYPSASTGAASGSKVYILNMAGNTIPNGTWDGTTASITNTSITIAQAGNGNWTPATGYLVFATGAFIAQNGSDGLNGASGYVYKYATAQSSSGTIVQPLVEWLPVEAQRKVAMLYQGTDGTKHQAIQIMKRDARNYFYDTKTSTYLVTLPAGWYCESEFGALNPYAGTYGEVATPKSAQSGNFNPLTPAVVVNATPIVINFNTVHNLATGDIILNSGYGGCTAANGEFSVTVTAPYQISLDNSVGNGAWTSGGTTTPYKNILSVYDKTNGRQWMKLFGQITQSGFSGSKASNTITFGVPHDGDAIIVSIGGITKGYFQSAISNPDYFSNIGGLADNIQRDFGAILSAPNNGSVITLNVTNTGASYNQGYLSLATFNLGTMGIGPVPLTAAGSTVNFSGGADVNSSNCYGRIYLTAKYSGYQESDPILQGFFKSDDPTMGPSFLLLPNINFALMNKELTALNLYAAYNTTTVYQAGWIDAPADYFLTFTLPIQQAPTDSNYVATAWTNEASLFKNTPFIYAYDIVNANQLLSSVSLQNAAVYGAEPTIDFNLNHPLSLVRSYPTPRFGVRIARQQKAISVIDFDDTTLGCSNTNGDGDNEDDNFPNENQSNDKPPIPLAIDLISSGTMMGLAAFEEMVHVFRQTERETQDLISGQPGIYKCDFTARKSLVKNAEFGALAWAGEYGFYVLERGGQQIPLSADLQNKYDGTLNISGTTIPYMTSTARAGVVGGFSQIYSLLLFAMQMNTSTAYENVCIVYSYAKRGLSGKNVGFYERKFNIGIDGTPSAGIVKFSSKRADATLTIAGLYGLYQYPLRSGSYIYEDGVRVDGAGNQYDSGKGIPTKIKIVFGELFGNMQKFFVKLLRIIYSGSTVSTTGVMNVRYLINDTEIPGADGNAPMFTQPIDGTTQRLRVRALGSHSSPGMQIDLTVGSEYDVKNLDISSIEIETGETKENYGNR